jgi:hypothetical protein
MSGVKFPSGKLHQYVLPWLQRNHSDLICLDNTPVTDFGAPNSVSGAKKGQS